MLASSQYASIGFTAVHGCYVANRTTCRNGPVFTRQHIFPLNYYLRIVSQVWIESNSKHQIASPARCHSWRCNIRKLFEISNIHTPLIITIGSLDVPSAAFSTNRFLDTVTSASFFLMTCIGCIDTHRQWRSWNRFKNLIFAYTVPGTPLPGNAKLSKSFVSRHVSCLTHTCKMRQLSAMYI